MPDVRNFFRETDFKKLLLKIVIFISVSGIEKIFICFFRQIDLNHPFGEYIGERTSHRISKK